MGVALPNRHQTLVSGRVVPRLCLGFALEFQKHEGCPFALSFQHVRHAAADDERATIRVERGLHAAAVFVPFRTGRMNIHFAEDIAFCHVYSSVLWPPGKTPGDRISRSTPAKGWRMCYAVKPAGGSQGTVPILAGIDTSSSSKSSEIAISLCFSPPGMSRDSPSPTRIWRPSSKTRSTQPRSV